MRQLKRWFGQLTIGVGLVGVLLTVSGVVILWRTASVFSAQAVEIADLAIVVQDNADEYVGQAENVVGNIQQKVKSLQQTTDQVSHDAQQNRDVVPILRKLDNEIVRELGEARNLLKSIQSGTVMLNQAVGLFDSLSSPARIFRRSAEPRENSDLSELSQSLVETSELIQQVIDFVAKMEQQGISAEQAMQMKQAVARLGEELDQAHAWIGSLQSFLRDTRDSVVTKRDRIPFWTNVGATICTVLFVCFGFTQIQLVGFGRSILVRTSQLPIADKRAQPDE